MTLRSTEGSLGRAWVLSTWKPHHHTTTQRLARPQAARSPTDRRATTLAWQRPPLSSCSLAPGLPVAAQWPRPFFSGKGSSASGLPALVEWGTCLSLYIPSTLPPHTRTHQTLTQGCFRTPKHALPRRPSPATKRTRPFPTHKGGGTLTRRRLHRRVYLGLWGDYRGEGTTNVCGAGADKTFGTRGLRPSSIATPERSRAPTPCPPVGFKEENLEINF